MSPDASSGKWPPIELEGFDESDDGNRGGNVSVALPANKAGALDDIPILTIEKWEPCSFGDLPVPDAPISIVRIDSNGFKIDGCQEVSGFLLTELDENRCVYFDGDDENAKTGYLQSVFMVRNSHSGDPEFILRAENGQLYRLIHIQSLDYDELEATGRVRRDVNATLN